MAARTNSTPLADSIRKLNGTAEAALEVQLPEGGEHHYYRNFASYSDALKEGLTSVQQMLTMCEALVRPRCTAPPDFTDADDVAEWTSSLLDDVLERLDSAMDAERVRASAGGRLGRGGQEEDTAAVAAAGGGGGQHDTALMSKLPSFGGAAVRTSRQRGPVRYAAGLARPQDAFDPPPDNRPEVPWRPRVEHLAGLTAARLDPQLYDTAPGAADGYPHPFRMELEALSYTPEQLRAPQPPPQRPSAPEATPLVWVDTPEGLEALAVDLEQPGRRGDGEQQGQGKAEGADGVSEIAVDLEQHSYRSYQGFTCLMQISTRAKDYVVDTLALRNQLGPALARVFADPRIVKVLHGADQDVEWLQRDHGLYLVNMFDTGQATRVLALPSNGLAYLLDTLCGSQADKRYQLADWRLRPLSPDMLHYARCDTHYLLYVYDKLREQLLALPEDRIPPSLAVPLPPGNPGGALGLVLERSRQLCLKTYHKPAFSPTAYQDTLLRWGLTLSPQQTAVFAALLAWRDRVCRAEDESPGYVLPKVQLVALAQAMPENAKRVQAVLGGAVSEVVTRRVAEVVAAISEARHRLIQPPELQPQPPVVASGAAPEAAASAAGGGSAAAATAMATVPPRSLPALKPRSVAPIKTAKAAAAAVAAAPTPVSAAAAAAAAPAPVALTLAESAVVPSGAEDGAVLAAAGQQKGQPGSIGTCTPAAVAAQESEPPVVVGTPAAPASGATVLACAVAVGGPAAGDVRHGAASGGLKPRALKPPPVVPSRAAALFGGSGSVPAAGAAGGRKGWDEAGGEPPGCDRAAAAVAAVTVVRSTEPAPAPRPAVAIKRPDAASVLGAMLGGGAGVGGIMARPRVQPAAAAAAATGGPAGARGAFAGSSEDEEALQAQERARRLRGTFALPFVATAPFPNAVTTAAKSGSGGEAFGEAAAAAAAGDGAAGEAAEGQPPAKRHNTAADVRAAVEAMRAAGDVEILMGPNGQGVQAPAGTAAAATAADHGAVGVADRAAPAARRVDLGSDEEDGDDVKEDGEAGGKGGPAEEEDTAGVGDDQGLRRGGSGAAGPGDVSGAAGASGPGGDGDGKGRGGGVATAHVAGSQLGLDMLEYVPLPLSQMFPKDKAADKKRGGGAAGSLREARGGARRAATKRLFITEVPAGGTTAEHGFGPSSDSDDGGGSDSDGSPTGGPLAKKQRKAPAAGTSAKKQQSGAQATPDTDAGAKRKDGIDRGCSRGGGPARRGRGGRSSLTGTGLLADFPRSNIVPSAPSDERGGRGRGGDRGGRRGGRGGRQPTAFNPYDIPDEFLMKGGKRSATMPRSGNRSFTFK